MADLIAYLYTAFLALMPISEVRGAVIYGLAIGLDKGVVLVLSILFNMLAIPIIWFFLNKAHFNKLAFKLFGKKMEQKIDKWKKKFEKYEELALLVFVAIPLPVTGAWTGTFIAHILKMDFKKAFYVISLGVVFAGLIVFYATLAGISLLNGWLK